MRLVDGWLNIRYISGHLPVVRIAFLLAGWLCIVTGVIGIFLPILPTTPFILLAAACFSRSSERLHRWLLEHRYFGTYIAEWEAHRVIPRRAKWLSSIMMTTMIGYPVFVYPHPLWFKALLIITCAGVSRFIWSCPDAPPPKQTPSTDPTRLHSLSDRNNP